MKSNRCVIIGAGEFCLSDIKKQLKPNEYDFCIAADGGVEYFGELGIFPDLIIGDMDSLKDKCLLSEQYSDIMIKKLPVEKDDTDMLAAVKEGLSQGYTFFEIYGALGGRLDHTIANIQCLKFLDNHNARGILYGSDLQIELICNNKVNYPKEKYKKGKRISVFAFGGDAYGVTEKGLKYELENAVISHDFPIGVSNEFIGSDSMIEVKDGTLLICIEL